MSSVVFNSFKQRFLNGEVPHDDVWKFIPVNKTFTQSFGQDEFPLEQYRSIDDFYDHNWSAMDNSYFEGIKRDIYWYKPADTDDIHKPMFITSGSIGEKGKYDSRSNWEEFQQTVYMKDISGNSAIPGYLASGGFYYIRTKDELRWFAARANTGNNRIIGVLGDGIDGVIRGQIGSDEKYPFQGIFDGNGHTLGDAAIICDSTDNGLVGVLGCDGVVKNIKLKNTTSGINMLCEKRIDLNHIKTDGRDINAGLLVGRNYGKIENIDGSELQTFKFSGFVPQVYSVTNKSDDYKDFYQTIRPKYDNGENFYFLNSWCINSPGNICPYVGYFAEGLFAQSARGYEKSSDGTVRVAAIEYAPALKSKYDAGLCDVSLDLTSKCSKICFYVKTYREPNTDTPTIHDDDYLHNQKLDTKWGTNCVMFVGFETQDETGKNVTYVLEMNGTAYDKKSGIGKRRYHFHCGHYNYKNSIKAIPANEDADDGYYKKVEDTYWFPIKKVYDNGDDDSTEEDGVSDEDYEISEEDIRVYTADGIPAKINNKDIQALYFSPRNFDTSSSVWETITWTCNINACVEIYFTAQMNTDSGIVPVDFYFYYDDTSKSKTTDFFDGPFKEAANYHLADGGDASAYTGSDTNFKVMRQALLTVIANGLQTDQYTNWVMTCSKPNHYAGTIIVDDQDRKFFARYFANRSAYGDDTWKENVSFGGLHSYDIGINNQDGIRSEGTLDITLLTVGRFQYRPFVHASPTSNTLFTYVDGDDDTYDVYLNAGTKMYLVSSYFLGAVPNNTSAAALEQAIQFMSGNAMQYIDNPNYYGMDRNGLWTTNCVRPDPENDSWKNMSADRESWISTLNFNWNIMQKMFETDNKYYTELTKYAQLDDGDDPGISYGDLDFADEWYRDSDLPHALLNKPIRMHNMARAAYYISPIAGANYGHIKNVIVSSDRENVGNFVGFIGSIAGKQERGVVESANVYAQDKFTYWAPVPQEPDRNYLTDEQYEQKYNEFTAAKAAYNFQVRYKQTPIMPSAVSEAVQTLGDNPDDDWTEWQYYPAEGAELVNEETVSSLSGTGTTGLKEYLDSVGVKMYSSNPGLVGDYTCESYQENPNYKFEKRFYDCATPIMLFTSAWYDDYKTTATEHFDDVITYTLRPIFNAGGLFGKIVPTYNENKIELDGNPTKGTLLHHIDVHYVLADPAKYQQLTAVSSVQQETKDIHNTYGAIAGLVEVQTSELGAWDYKDKNSVNLGNMNVSAEGNVKPGYPLTPFGFVAYQPTELNTVQATKSSPRQKNGDWCGEYTETTWALDAPIVINNKMWWSKNSYAFAPINQSSAAFFMIDKSPYKLGKEHTIQEYMQTMVNKLFSPYSGREGYTVNINGSTLAYSNPYALDLCWNRRGPMAIAASFGSNVTFEPAKSLDSTKATSSSPQEILNIYDPSYQETRTYGMYRHALKADGDFEDVTEFSPVNVDCLSDGEIFNGKSKIDDKYFDYTYRETTAFVDDWTFTHNVIFTSALKDKDAGKAVTMNEKATLGYVFRDPMNYSADGFWYNYNYLHIGNSVSPAYIRDQVKEPGSTLHTSACSGAYYDENGELVSANGNHDFGGLLVVDGEDRTVMFIDNTNGAKIDGGSWNMACEPCTYQGHRGGLLLEVK